MSNLYGVYYYSNTFSGYAPTVKVMYFSNDVNKAKQFATEKFTNIHKHINNTYYAVRNNTSYIMWINTYEMDKEIKDVGLGCNQPSKAINIT